MTLCYITPIFDRNSNDILQKTDKAFFNVTDYLRIDNNIRYAKELIERVHGEFQLETIEEPSIGDIINPEDINILVRNIIAVQDKAIFVNTQKYKLSDQYEQNGMFPDYFEINKWEKVLDIIVQKYDHFYIGRMPIISKATSGLKLMLQNYFRKTR